MHQPTDADDTTGHRAEVLGDEGLDDVLFHLSLDIGVVCHAEIEGKEVGCHGVVAIKSAVWIEDMPGHRGGAFLAGEELAVECLLGEGGFFLEVAGVIALALHLCKLFHQEAEAVVIG